ncbi:DUF3813 domain-containing protein [Fictibacillus sp. Mic-4]|uniref:DUF3813 domain-containing protein n=1 Tax=Fictibacillus TaxID=1329200 RepID=UPI0003FA2D4C|nr:DUF3813 domain-containing protein [Fictibacillus gelatini]
MANKLFQLAKNAVNNVIGKMQGETNGQSNETVTSVQNTTVTEEDKRIAQNMISSAMANSTEAEKEQLAELQTELDQSTKME